MGDKDINKYPSTAFLISNTKDQQSGSAVLFMGNVGTEQSIKLLHVWENIAPYIKSGHLKTIFVSCGYADGERIDDEIAKIGQFTPKILISELNKLSGKLKAIGAKLKWPLDVVVMGQRPSFEYHGTPDYNKLADETIVKIEEIERQLKDGTVKGLKVNYIFPKSTDLLYVTGGQPLVHSPYVPKKQNVLPYFGDYYGLRDVYSDYPALRGPHNDGSGNYFLEEVAVLFGALMIVVCTLCFVLGVVFGVGLPAWKRWREKNRNKRMN